MDRQLPYSPRVLISSCSYGDGLYECGGLPFQLGEISLHDFDLL
jgi:hypothetical protein